MNTPESFHLLPDPGPRQSSSLGGFGVCMLGVRGEAVTLGGSRKGRLPFWRRGCTAWFPALQEALELPPRSLVPFSVSWKALIFPTLDPSCQPPPRICTPEAPSILEAVQSWQIRKAPCNCQGQPLTQLGRGWSPSGRRPAATPHGLRGAQGKGKVNYGASTP